MRNVAICLLSPKERMWGSGNYLQRMLAPCEREGERDGMLGLCVNRLSHISPSIPCVFAFAAIECEKRMCWMVHANREKRKSFMKFLLADDDNVRRVRMHAQAQNFNQFSSQLSRTDWLGIDETIDFNEISFRYAVMTDHNFSLIWICRLSDWAHAQTHTRTAKIVHRPAGRQSINESFWPSRAYVHMKSARARVRQVHLPLNFISFFFL